MADSIEFNWKSEEFDFLLRACEISEDIQCFFEKVVVSKNDIILEAGCGIGATVKYIYDKGYKNIHGIEINQKGVEIINKRYPELKVQQGNIMQMPYPDNYFDSILSLGVVEHFPAGLDNPLKAIYNVLKPEGKAIITVPSMNILRRGNYFFQRIIYVFDIRKNKFIRKLFNKAPFHKTQYKYYVYPDINNFYEYRLTPKQFKNECVNAGFTIIESIPFAHIDGLYHCIGHPLLITFKDWTFKVTKAGKIINNVFKLIPFFHNHMHALIVKK